MNPFVFPPQPHRNKVYHEVGHAVVAVVSGATLNHIDTDEASGNYHILASNWPNTGIGYVDCQMAGILGDWLAEGKAGKPSWYDDHAYTRPGGRGDYTKIMDIVKGLNVNDPQALLNDLEAQGKDNAWAILDKQRAAVDALATALLTTPVMSGAAATAIINANLVP